MSRISFCTTCMNREDQLKKTLPHNLSILKRYKEGEVELCLINFIKDEEGKKIDDWIRALDRIPNFKYYASNSLKYWHASIAKNTAHLAAHGDFLVNLDCDNFLDAEELDQLIQYNQGNLQNTIYWAFSGNVEKIKKIKINKYLRVKYKARKNPERIQDGTYGRIGLPKTDFFAIGGYDESLPPMGGQDQNLFRRAVAVYRKHQLIHIPASIPPLKNSKLDGLKHSEYPDADWMHFNKMARTQTIQALREGLIVVNKNKEIGVPFEKIF